MRRKTRVTLAAASLAGALALAACGGGGGAAGGGATTMKLALNQTESHPSFIALEAFGDSLSGATEGRWDVQVYPNSTLGDQGEYLQSVSTGVVDMAIVSAPQLENLSKDYVIFSLPTVFDSIDHQMKVLDDPAVVGEVYTSLEASNKITVVGGFTQGERSVYTKDAPARTPADLAGKKIRVQESPVFLSMINALGASPTPMAFGEVYTGLQSGVIDGAENNEISYFTQKHFEVAPYFSYSRHLIGTDFLIINTDTLNEMSAEDRAAFDKAWDAAWAQHTELWKADTEKAVTDATAGGATFTEVDSAAFVEALKPLLSEFITEDSQQKLYDGIRAQAQVQ
jgi:tripartite ATP-independent transporter DctP family solute receptor